MYLVDLASLRELRSTRTRCSHTVTSTATHARPACLVFLSVQFAVLGIPHSPPCPPPYLPKQPLRSAVLSAVQVQYLAGRRRVRQGQVGCGKRMTLLGVPIPGPTTNQSRCHCPYSRQPGALTAAGFLSPSLLSRSAIHGFCLLAVAAHYTLASSCLLHYCY